LHVALSDSDQDLVGGGPGTEAYHNRFTAPSPAELAPLFPQLEILELLGQGGMGAVYKARQTKLDRLVALKILPVGEERDTAFAERFAREARALAKLNHPNIVAVYDFGEAAGLYYFIMEFVDGTNLRQLLQTRQLDPSEALQIVPQICDALQYAHEEEIVHRDIKPENILLDKRGRVKIADFGLAKLLARSGSDLTLTGSRQVMGTLHYMAPEQIEKPHTVDHRADIYSLGVVFYEMLTGELPLGRFSPPSQKMPMDARLDDMVLRALAKEPEKRYQRIRELKMDVAPIAAACLPETPVERAVPEVAKPRKPKAGILGSVRSFVDSVRYYILDSAADQRSASLFTDSRSEKPRLQESTPRRRWWPAALLMILLAAVGYAAGFSTAKVLTQEDLPATEVIAPTKASPMIPYEQSGKFHTVSGQEGVINFPIPYRQPPNVELQMNLWNRTIITECTATGFKWRNTGGGPNEGPNDNFNNELVTWVAKGVQ
jgi:serine/threonine protein kinase